MKVPKKISTGNKREAVDTKEVIQISKTIWKRYSLIAHAFL